VTPPLTGAVRTEPADPRNERISSRPAPPALCKRHESHSSARSSVSSPLLRTGCLIFAPFITLTMWFLQAVVWLMVGTPILIYALVMAALGGGFAGDQRRH
jgi:hypothetical protein